MFKIVFAAALMGLLAACSSLSGSGNSTPDPYWANANPPRSPGEGPSFHPVYP